MFNPAEERAKLEADAQEMEVDTNLNNIPPASPTVLD